MTREEFIVELSAALANHSDLAGERLRNLVSLLPSRATRLDLEVIPSQDGDGFFTIHSSVDGPDLYVINKAIRPHANLFDTKHTEKGLEPSIPIVDPDDVNYPVNDIVADCSAEWLQRVWASLGGIDCPIPVVVIGHDDYGTLTPRELHSGKKYTAG